MGLDALKWSFPRDVQYKTGGTLGPAPRFSGLNAEDQTTKSLRHEDFKEYFSSCLGVFVANSLFLVVNTELRLEQTDYFANIGESANGLLGEYELFPVFNFKHPTT